MVVVSGSSSKVEADIAHSSSSTYRSSSSSSCSSSSAREGGATPLYKPYRYVPPHRLGFLRRFGLKTGIHFAHVGLESGLVFERTTECMNVLIVSIPVE